MNFPGHLFRDPATGIAIKKQANGEWLSDNGEVSWPCIDGVPWAYADPEAHIAQWQNKIAHFFQRENWEIELRKDDLQRSGSSSPTGQRLLQFVEKKQAYLDQLRELLSSYENLETGMVDFYQALQCELPLNQNASSYHENLFRDWCWGETENQLSLELVAKCIEQADKLKNVLVLGAGAGRLGYDIHERFSPDYSILMDINPLLLGVGNRIMRGETLELWEFPTAPRCPDVEVVKQQLCCPAKAPDNLLTLYGNALDAPFFEQSLSAIVTPWLIDIIGEDTVSLARRINTLLPDGGIWVNFGPLHHYLKPFSQRYHAEEIQQILAVNGFEVAHWGTTDIPYLDNPASAKRSQQQVHSFAARKIGRCPKPQPHKPIPAWLNNTRKPIPATPAWENLSVQLTLQREVLARIDGRHSIRQIAEQLSPQLGLPVQQLEQLVATFIHSHVISGFHNGSNLK